MGVLDTEMVLFAKDVGESPVTESVDVAEFAFAIEDFLRPFTGQTQRFGERAQQFDDLSDMVVVLAVLGAGLRVEEVVACNQFESLVT